MKIETEVTILEVDKKALEQKLEKLGAKKVYDGLQRRYTFDMIPKNPNKWMRLRTNGEKTTLTIKEIVDNMIAGGTKEWEVLVSDFDETKNILNELGFEHRNYQENYRTMYVYKDAEISIDSWPKIPTYCEVECDDETQINELLKKLNLDNEVTTLDVVEIYKQKYGIDILSIKNLIFD